MPTRPDKQEAGHTPDMLEALQSAPRPFVKIESDPDGLSAFVIAYADWFFKVRGAAITRAKATA